MHRWDETTDEAFDLVSRFVRERLSEDPVPLDSSASPEALARAAPNPIGEMPRDVAEVFALYEQVLAPAVLSADSPRFLSFIPSAPTKLACLFDMVVSASSLNGTSWLEAAGAIHAENQVLRVLADAAGLPDGAGGCFLSGASAGNLSALAVARDVARHRRGDTARMRIVTSEQAHSSVRSTANLLDCDVVVLEAREGRLAGSTVESFLASDDDPSTVCAVVATAGTTNAGLIDDLDGIGATARRFGVWFHVDAAYGGAGLFAPSVRRRFAGIERADSMTVDPHKWLFAPLDCAALLYANPMPAKAVHTQDASYLDSIHRSDVEWNPTDYAYHLSRRARGLATWFSMAVHGLGAYRDAVESALATAREVAARIDRSPHLRLVMTPELSVVMFERIGWSAADYELWSGRLLESGVGFVLPSSWDGRPVLRLAIVHPGTTATLVDEILATL